MDENKDHSAIRLPPDSEKEGRYARSSSQKNDASIVDSKVIAINSDDIESSTTGDHSKNHGGLKAIGKRIMVWFAWSVFSLYIISKLFYLIFPIVWHNSDECVLALDYDPNAFPFSIAQLHLDSSIKDLADRYGKDIMGKNCRSLRILRPQDAVISENRPIPSMWQPKSASQSFSAPSPSETFFKDHFMDTVPVGNEENLFVAKDVPLASIMPLKVSSFQNAPYSSVHPNSAAPRPTSSIAFSDALLQHPDNWRTRKILPQVMDDGTRYMSINESNIYALSINSMDSLEIVTEIMTESQAQQNNSGMIKLYLKPYDDNNNNPYDNYFERLVDFTMVASGRRAVVTIEHSGNRHNPSYRNDIKCKLLIVVPDQGHMFQKMEEAYENANGTTTFATSYVRGFSNLRRISIMAQKGKVIGNHLTFNDLVIKLGRGHVYLSTVDVHKLNTAVLYGNVELNGITISKSLASGVIRGSSSVLAKIHPENPRDAYDIINMCADGYTYTDVMTTQDSREQFAADFYIYRKTGTLPPDQRPPAVITPPETSYTYSEPNLAHVDETSTDVFKTGYLVRKNSGSHISIYAGAKTAQSLKQKSRFLFGYYY
ncbi:hypothetical protein BDA99DRAFT_558039 [Phascolomyces articulosus]|uniref:Uncharacterized protein n=1 Tax=Phascolomyces articulosus TaxID=60185 RepID=A0AAD5K5F3_9FUNG|nr:hypothetical protein BDA99DRAFT_558039 [Phascolomyces articulosus]